MKGQTIHFTMGTENAIMKGCAWFTLEQPIRLRAREEYEVNLYGNILKVRNLTLRRDYPSIRVNRLDRPSVKS